MEKNYDPKKIEEKWYRWWLERGLFHGEAARGGEPYCVVIPPPNVTGILHMGHALNNIIQDILVRRRRMQGRNVVWMPGTDHAGIATQNVVERALRKEGKSRDDLGRDAFVERVWKWREEYGGTIIKQLKRLGSSCDWQRERFTMDEGLSEAVAEVFARLYDKGLIYRANRIINWCPRCQTALSDEESEHTDTKGKLYYIRYPIKSAKTVEPRLVPAKPGEAGTLNPEPRTPNPYIVVATTRPETLLGDVAVAVNPNDSRYGDLGKKTILLPALNRELKVIADDFVNPEFGTGIVKVTPAHDPNDFEMGQRHGLTPINVMNGDGTMNREAGTYAGMDRFECRKKILEDLDAAGLIEKIADHFHAVGHCYRCGAVVEPRLSPQWFVRMKPLAGPAIEAVKSGRVKFVPGRWTKVYLDWMENIRDWCISRQIWWGHRIPMFYCDSCGHQWAQKGRAEACPKCHAKTIRQDEDVLDTWFSSWLWPFSTFGWPARGGDLAFYYPTHDLVTASEIIFFWVARMIMAGLEFMGDAPFRTVYIHGTVRDHEGSKMSKSLGNSIDPLTIIEEYSADALRFSLMMITATGQDVYVSNEKFEIGRNFGTKLWNAARFMLMHSESADEKPLPLPGKGEPAFDPALFSPDDRHIIARLRDAIKACDDNLEKYRFNDAALALYEFVWHQFCDWYLETSKVVLYGDDAARKAQTLKVMRHVFCAALRLLHPFMPFVTEELWQALGFGNSDKNAADDRGYSSIMIAEWPEPASDETFNKWGIDDFLVNYVDDKHDLVKVGRTLRADYGILPAKKIDYLIKPNSEEAVRLLEKDRHSISALLGAANLEIGLGVAPNRPMPSGLAKLGAIYMPLEGLVDVAAEIRRLSAQMEKTADDLKRANGKLNNVAFVSKAPPEVVEQQKARRDDLLARNEKLRRLVSTLSEMERS